MRVATEQDIPWIRSFLTEHIETSMFALANLEEHGLNGQHDRSLSVWIAPEQRGVLSVTKDGTLLPQLPDARDWPSAAKCVSGRHIIGCLGPAPQARGLMAACEIDNLAMDIDRDEPLMTLSLNALEAETRGHLIPFAKMPEDIALAWRIEYFEVVLGAPAHLAKERAQGEMVKLSQADRHRCLLLDGKPVAMTGFNARTETAVQLGGVFTPQEHRGKGYAGIAIRHHLHEARAGGAETAILFAASEAAQSAYRRIGFEQIGHYSMCMFQTPAVAK